MPDGSGLGASSAKQAVDTPTNSAEAKMIAVQADTNDKGRNRPLVRFFILFLLLLKREQLRVQLYDQQ
jgi:hypothetical protein